MWPLSAALDLFSAACVLLRSSSAPRACVSRASPFPCSASGEELTPEPAGADPADSGRGSWTSCSSNSHDNFQNLQPQRAWDVGGLRNQALGRAAAEAEACGPREAGEGGPGLAAEDSRARESWASCSSLSESCDYSTVRRRVPDKLTIPGMCPDGTLGSDATYKTVTSSTEKGLIGETRAFAGWGHTCMVQVSFTCCFLLTCYIWAIMHHMIFLFAEVQVYITVPLVAFPLLLAFETHTLGVRWKLNLAALMPRRSLYSTVV